MHRYEKSRYLCRCFLMHRLFVKKRLSTFAHISSLQPIKDLCHTEQKSMHFYSRGGANSTPLRQSACSPYSMC